MTRLPPYRLLPIIRDLRQELGEEGDRVEYLDQLTEILTNRLGESLAAEPEGAGATLKYIGLGAAGAAALCLVGFFVNRRLRAAEERARIRFFFPEVHVATRLGAPSGGGRTSVVRFGTPGTGDR